MRCMAVVFHLLLATREGCRAAATESMLPLDEADLSAGRQLNEADLPPRPQLNEADLLTGLPHDEANLPAGLPLDEADPRDVPAGLQLNEADLPAGLPLNEADLPAGPQFNYTDLQAGPSLDETDLPAGLYLDEAELPAGPQLNEVDLPDVPQLIEADLLDGLSHNEADLLVGSQLNEAEHVAELPLNETDLLDRPQLSKVDLPAGPQLNEVDQPAWLPRDEADLPAAPPGYPKGIYVNYAKEIWMSSNSGSAPYANDGVQRGFFGQKDIAVTEVEDSPWLLVDLGQVRVVEGAELWVPLNPCASLKQTAKKCHPGMPVTSSQPLEVILEGQAGNHMATHKITDQLPVYVWDRVDIPARYVRFRLPGPSRQLHAAEVKVWVGDHDMQLCTERSCKGGKCTCVGEGCPGQVCSCDPSRLGTEDCMTDPRKDWRYLPLQAAGPSERWRPDLWEKLMRELKTLQSPKKKCNGEVFNGLIGAGARGAGLASTLHFVTGQLSEAYFKGRPFVFGGQFNYAGTKHCKKKGMLGDFDCYFETFSGSSCLLAKDAARKSFKGIKVNPKQPNRCAIGRLCNDVGHFKRLPEGEYGEQGLFWWRAAMAAHLLRMNSETATMVGLEELKRRTGFEHPIVGVHIRHGDACHTTLRKGRCKGLEYYIPEIRLMAQRYNTNRVYLATDDDSVVKDTRRFPEFQFVFPEFDRGMLNSKEQIEYRKNLWDGSNDDGHSIMLSSLVDLFLLAESDFLILHLLSNMSRLALELSAAVHQRVPPYISMDGPWCHHWKMCMG